MIGSSLRQRVVTRVTVHAPFSRGALLTFSNRRRWGFFADSEPRCTSEHRRQLRRWEPSGMQQRICQILRPRDLSAGTDLELLLSRCEMAAELDPLSPCEAFRRTAESMIVERCSFVTKDTKLDHHQSFLRRAVRRSGRLGRAQVFTTNYDEAFEYAAASIGYVVIDGFSYTVPRHFDPNYFDYDFVRRSHDGSPADYVPEVFYLHKLHGSVNWDASSSPIVQTTRPVRPLLVFPRQSKYELSYQRPFLDSMGRYQTMLREPNLGLLIIGFGFHDKHLVEPLLSALRSNASLRLVVVDPSLPQSSNSSVAALRTVVQSGDSRVTLVAAQFEDLQVLIPDIAPASDAERRERLLREILEP
jgi:hypothetical protein